MKRALVLVTATCVVLCCALIVAWSATYPDRGDPKNIKYVLWKKGLYPLDPDVATGAMIGDTGREKLVIGKSKEQLAKKFGFLTPIEHASEYNKLVAAEMHLGSGNYEVFVLRKSSWLVVFSQDRASELILVKGF